MMKRSLPVLSLLAFATGFVRAADAPMAPTIPAVPVAHPGVPVSGPQLRATAPGLGSLTPEERTKYEEIMKGLSSNVDVKAAMENARKAQEEARKAQQTAMEAMTKVRTARENAVKSAGPEAAALMAKVEAGRKQWMEEQRAKYMSRAQPGSGVPMPGSPSPAGGIPVPPAPTEPKPVVAPAAK